MVINLGYSQNPFFYETGRVNECNRLISSTMKSCSHFMLGYTAVVNNASTENDCTAGVWDYCNCCSRRFVLLVGRASPGASPQPPDERNLYRNRRRSLQTQIDSR